MSDVSLADSALSDPEAQPVGNDALGTSGEVGNGSASNGQAPEGFIEKARFDGLMGRFNRTQNELLQVRSQIESLQSAREEEVPVSDPAVTQQLQVLTDMLLKERAENARNAVLVEYPELKPFADLLVADSPEDLREVASVFSERLKQVTDTPAAEDPALDATDPAPVVPAVDAGATDPVVQAPPVVTGGTTTFDGGAGIQERIESALQTKDFPSYVKLIRERAVLAAEGVLEQD